MNQKNMETKHIGNQEFQETAGKTAKKFGGVMLALTIRDAQRLNAFLVTSNTAKCTLGFSEENLEALKRISSRIEKQIQKREEAKNQELNKKMDPMMGTIAEAVQGIIDETFATAEDRRQAMADGVKYEEIDKETKQ